MMKNKKFIWIFGAFLVFLSSLFAQTIETAPFNSKFLNYSNENQSSIEIPPPMSLPPALYSSAPPSFDLRSYKRTTPVKDQGTAGSCWAFATYASLESYLLSNGETWDFSENHMKNTLSSSYAEGFDRKASDGGNQFMSTAYLVRWSGPISELDDPYNANSSTSPENIKPVKHVQEVVFIPDRQSPVDNNGIKQAVMKYGAIYTTMYYNNAFLAKGKNYYYNGSATSNHAVSIVGWIDNYSRTNFYGSASGIPPGDGAFIVKNSWGTLWGESGYFYISYYDSNIGKNCVVFNNAEPTNNYETIYQYDPLGWVTSVGFNSDTAHFANIYTANSNGLIQAVGFYTPVQNSQYEVKIYKNVSQNSPVDGVVATAKTGIISDPGYHTIKLSEDVSVSKNEKFSAVVKLKTPNYNYPIPVEMPFSGYSSKANATPGQSFVSKDGINWQDITTSMSGTNVCIKVYGSGRGIQVISPNGKEIWEQGSTQTIAWSYNGAVKGKIKIELLKNEKLVSIIATDVSIGLNGNGSYQWKIPASMGVSDSYKIRITNTDNPAITDSSDETFSIISGKIIVEHPYEKASFSRGTSQLIQWKSSGNIGSYVKIYLLKSGIPTGNIATSAPSKTNGTSTYVWRIPPNIMPGDDYSIKIVSVTNTEVYAISPVFSISGPSIKVTSPDGGETWYTGTKQNITWTFNGNTGCYVKIECLKGTTSTMVAQIFNSGSSGLYQWSIPATLKPSSDYKIKITSVNEPYITDTSDETFSISSGSINVISPSAGEIWKTGEVKTIVWKYEGNPGSYVNIQLTKDTQTFMTVANYVPIGNGGTGSYKWKIPAILTPGSSYRIKIVVSTNPQISSVSDNFSISSTTVNNMFNNRYLENYHDDY